MAHLGQERAETLPTTVPGAGIAQYRAVAEARSTPVEPAPAAGAPLAPGDRLAERFVIERELGRGGGGAVYLARDLKLDRAVAIKVLPRGPADETALRRFEQEARAPSRLEHPNVLAVHDVGVHGGAPFIVSELLEGSTLRDKIAQGALAVGEAVRLALQLAQGLAATHAKDIGCGRTSTRIAPIIVDSLSPIRP